MVHNIKDKDEFDRKLEEAKDKLIVVDFYATWCGPCKTVSPKLEELAQQYPEVVFLKVDVDECEDIALEYNIQAMPTFVFIKNKSKVDEFSGANLDKLKETLERHK